MLEYGLRVACAKNLLEKNGSKRTTQKNATQALLARRKLRVTRLVDVHGRSWLPFCRPFQSGQATRLRMRRILKKKIFAIK